MKSDRFLTFLLIGIGVLVILAVGLFLARSGTQQTYGPEATPEGVIHNYILAVQKQDYARAYSYLSDTTQGKPSMVTFQQMLVNMQSEMLNTGVEIGGAQIYGDQTAVTAITLIHNQQGIFSNPYREVQSISTVRENGAWKIINIPYPYGDYGWYQGYGTTKEAQPVPAN